MKKKQKQPMYLSALLTEVFYPAGSKSQVWASNYLKQANKRIERKENEKNQSR